VAVLSYAPDNLDRSFAKAKSYLTGNFLAYYTKFTEQIAAIAQQKQVTETAQVVRAAVSELHPDSAVVLVFINQTATSKAKPEPQTTASSARVTVTKVKGSWLISQLDPLS
jgi:Mce-associated membrane protein